MPQGLNSPPHECSFCKGTGWAIVVRSPEKFVKGVVQPGKGITPNADLDLRRCPMGCKPEQFGDDYSKSIEIVPWREFYGLPPKQAK